MTDQIYDALNNGWQLTAVNYFKNRRNEYRNNKL